jgi:hypothetical protein
LKVELHQGSAESHDCAGVEPEMSDQPWREHLCWAWGEVSLSRGAGQQFARRDFVTREDLRNEEFHERLFCVVA